MIRAHGIDYEVNLVSNRLVGSNIGVFDAQECEIRILSDEIKPQKQQQVFWHEVVHLLLEDEDHDAYHGDWEPLVRRLGTKLFSVLGDNNLLREDWWERVVDRE